MITFDFAKEFCIPSKELADSIAQNHKWKFLGSEFDTNYFCNEKFHKRICCNNCFPPREFANNQVIFTSYAPCSCVGAKCAA